MGTSDEREEGGRRDAWRRLWWDPASRNVRSSSREIDDDDDDDDAEDGPDRNDERDRKSVV